MHIWFYNSGVIEGNSRRILLVCQSEIWLNSLLNVLTFHVYQFLVWIPLYHNLYTSLGEQCSYSTISFVQLSDKCRRMSCTGARSKRLMQSSITHSAGRGALQDSFPGLKLERQTLQLRVLLQRCAGRYQHSTGMKWKNNCLCSTICLTSCQGSAYHKILSRETTSYLYYLPFNYLPFEAEVFILYVTMQQTVTTPVSK